MEREVAEYKETLVRFTSIKRDDGGVSSRAIETLTDMAKNKSIYASEIVKCIKNRWTEVTADHFQLIIYLLDLICKYPGSPYKVHFQHNLEYDISFIFEKVSKRVREEIYNLRKNWGGRYQVFTDDKLYQLDLKIKEIDPTWPVFKTTSKKRKSPEDLLSSSPTREKEPGHTSSLDQDTCPGRTSKLQKTEHIVSVQPTALGAKEIEITTSDNIAHSSKPVRPLVDQPGAEDLLLLRGCNWLNDNIIDFYLSMIEYRSLTHTNLPSIYVYSIHFYPKLCKGGHRAVAKWTKDRDIFDYDLLLIPIHLGNHWCLATVDPKARVIRYFDSKRNDNLPCLNTLDEYLREEHRLRKLQLLAPGAFRLKHVKTAPQQKNNYDCGVFVCTTAEYLARGEDLSFSEADMPNIRKRMVEEIKSNSLFNLKPGR